VLLLLKVLFVDFSRIRLVGLIADERRSVRQQCRDIVCGLQREVVCDSVAQKRDLTRLAPLVCEVP